MIFNHCNDRQLTCHTRPFIKLIQYSVLLMEIPTYSFSIFHFLFQLHIFTYKISFDMCSIYLCFHTSHDDSGKYQSFMYVFLWTISSHLSGEQKKCIKRIQIRRSITGRTELSYLWPALGRIMQGLSIR